MSTREDPSATLTSRRSVERTQRTAHASRRTVLIALAANAVVTVAKLAGGLVSGSAALLAEAAHSVADTTNQGFLLVSISLSERDPTPDQPFGYGRARFLWTFIAAVAMFVAGALFAIGYGVYQLLSAPESTRFAAAYVTLAIAGVAEGASWMRAVRQTRHEAGEADLALLRYVRSSRDPNVKMVLFEDTAALIGIALALVGIVADQVTGSTVFDPAASIAIGVLLVGVAGWMGHDTAELLIGGAARPDEREALVARARGVRSGRLGRRAADDDARPQLAAGRGTDRPGGRSRRRRRSSSCPTRSTSSCARWCPTSPRCSSTRPRRHRGGKSGRRSWTLSSK